jgi:hypothetical protein
MAMFKGFKPQGLQKIATRMGYAGSMENFDDYLKQNPDKEREMIVYRSKAQEMARGGAVVRMANGGAPLFGTVGTPERLAGMLGTQIGTVGGSMPIGVGTNPANFGMPYDGFDKFRNRDPRYSNTLPDYEEFKQYQSQIPNNMFRVAAAVVVPRRLADGTVINFGNPIEAEDYDNYLRSIGKPPTTSVSEMTNLGSLPSDPRDDDFQPMPQQVDTPTGLPLKPGMEQQVPGFPSTAVPNTNVGNTRMSTSPLNDPRANMQQAYVPTLGTGAGQIPAYGTSGDPKSIGNVATNLAQTGAIPVGAVTQPELTATNQQQIIDPTTGQLTSTPVAPTYGAETAGAIAPTTVTSTAMDAVQAAPAVQTAIQTNQAAQANVADPRAQVLAAQQTASSVSNLQAAQGTATLINNPVQRQIQSGELISGGVANAQTAANFTEQIQSATATPSEKATVQGQLATLTANFDATNPPAWAAGAIRGVQAMMQQRGLGASSMAGQALIQGVFESALPIAQADAQVTAQFEAQNLSNRQQRAMLAAQQRATFIGQEFDQAFQTRVANAAKIGDIANMNFTSDQQVMLENSRATNTMNLNNLSNKQAMVIAEASALANMDLSNLSNAQQASVQNASNFLQLDMANLSNEQQTALFNAQAINQSILTDQAAQNAANQFNATSQNQVDQFMANLANQVAQFNATQTNAQNQFNAGELNTLSRFNAEVANQRDQFNAQNQLAIAQNNAVWRREIATADTATINRANELNAKAVLDVSNTQYDNLWNYYADTMEWAWKSAESEQERIKDLVVANLDKEAKEYQAQLNSASQGGAAIGNLIGTLGGAALQFGFGNVFP